MHPIKTRDRTTHIDDILSDMQNRWEPAAWPAYEIPCQKPSLGDQIERLTAISKGRKGVFTHDRDTHETRFIPATKVDGISLDEEIEFGKLDPDHEALVIHHSNDDETYLDFIHMPEPDPLA